MQHQLCESFYKYWQSCRQGHSLPLLIDFPHEKLDEFEGSGLILVYRDNEIVLDFLGSNNQIVLSDDLLGQPITALYPNSLKAMQMALLMPIIRQRIGLSRLSRLWYGHRHKEVEWVLLPVIDSQTGDVAIVGVAATFVEKDSRDKLAIGAATVERVVRQDYFSFGRAVDFAIIDGHSWAVLDAMGAVISVDGQPIEHEDIGIAGGAGRTAAKAARPNVLAVAPAGDFSRISQRLGSRYNLKMVETSQEAQDVLRNDMIDILVTAENFDGGTGAELIKDAQKISAFTSCVMMLDRNNEAEDTCFEEDGNRVQHLVKPVGEFALRRALDAANAHVVKKRKADSD